MIKYGDFVYLTGATTPAAGVAVSVYITNTTTSADFYDSLGAPTVDTPVTDATGYFEFYTSAGSYDLWVLGEKYYSISINEVTGIPDPLTINTLQTVNLELSGTAVTASAAELNKLDGVPAGLTATEIGYLDGVTSSIQTQLNTIAPIDTRVTVLEDRVASTNSLVDLRRALEYEFHSVVNIRCIGDSITWGLVTTGQGETLPRTQALTDVRNNLTSPCYVNLLRNYLGEKYAGGAVIAGDPGSGYFQRLANVSLASEEVIPLTSTGVPYTKVVGTNSNTFLGDFMDVATTGGLEFDFYGDSFTVHYVTTPGFGRFEVFIDASSQGITDTNVALDWDATVDFTMTLGQHHIRIGNADVGTGCRISGLSWNKRVQIANDGIIGITSNEWKVGSANFTGSIAATDEFVIINIGTNDRSGATAPTAPTKLINNLVGIVENLRDIQSKKPILVAPNSVTQDESSYDFTQGAVASAVERVGTITSVPVVGCFSVTSLQDGLHPNDAGHADMFAKFVSALER